MGYLDPDQGAIREGIIPPMDPAAAVVDLTAATGSASNTISDVGASFNQTTLNNNFKSLASKVNALLAALRAAGFVDE